jgi:predicted ABC-type ATPase
VTTPVLHLLAGPNGAGKSTFVRDVLKPVTHLPFVNADMIAAQRWPGEEESHAHAASRLAAAQRDELLFARTSFISETVFSHVSKVDLVRDAATAGFRIHLHVILVPVNVAVGRVTYRAAHGGHTVPEDHIRARYERLWDLIAQAIPAADAVTVYDNSRAATPFRRVARFANGQLIGTPAWPRWTPHALVAAFR